MKARILYAEDDATLAYLTKDSLELHGYEVVHCSTGKMCLDQFRLGAVDLCVLDIMLPGIDGFEVATEIRHIDANVPIIFLSAKTLREDRLKGLRIGADDYLVKPFSMEELMLKIEIFLRRSGKRASEKRIYEIGKMTFDSENFLLQTPSGTLVLRQRDSELLKFFLDNRNVTLKRETILIAVWGEDDYSMGRSLDVYISRLRKILAGESSVTIENVHSIGFRFSDKK